MPETSKLSAVTIGDETFIQVDVVRHDVDAKITVEDRDPNLTNRKVVLRGITGAALKAFDTIKPRVVRLSISAAPDLRLKDCLITIPDDRSEVVIEGHHYER